MNNNSRSVIYKPIVAGALASFIGITSSVAIVVQGLKGVGANSVEIASGLMMLSVLMGIGGIMLSWQTKMPISVAWSTPGAAFLASIGLENGDFSLAVGAFIICAVLTILSGLYKPIAKWVALIPKSIASAMLAGILLPLCLAPFQAVAAYPLVAVPVVVIWLIVGRINHLFAVPAALVMTIIMTLLTLDFDGTNIVFDWTEPLFIMPSFSIASMIGIAIPLYVITMASQNITGIAVLSSFNYKPNASSLFRQVGLYSLLSAPFGAHTINLAAITAAICANKDAHPDPDKRYQSVIVSGIIYIIFGLMAGTAVALIEEFPAIIIAAVAGLALLSAFKDSLIAAISIKKEREVVIITFLITASSVTFLGISGAFWGLIIGCFIYFLECRYR